MPANVENSAVATGLEKVQFSFQSQRKEMAKNAQTTAQLHSCNFHMPAKLCSKSFDLGFSSTMNQWFSDVQAGFRKGGEIRDQIANIRWVREKAKELKTIHFCFTDHSLWLCGSQQTVKNS